MYGISQNCVIIYLEGSDFGQGTKWILGPLDPSQRMQYSVLSLYSAISTLMQSLSPEEAESDSDCFTSPA